MRRSRVWIHIGTRVSVKLANGSYTDSWNCHAVSIRRRFMAKARLEVPWTGVFYPIRQWCLSFALSRAVAESLITDNPAWGNCGAPIRLSERRASEGTPIPHHHPRTSSSVRAPLFEYGYRLDGIIESASRPCRSRQDPCPQSILPQRLCKVQGSAGMYQLLPADVLL